MTLPILYSFRRCPYAMRARLAIYASGKTIEQRDILLKHKPQAMSAISPKGTVPVLQLPDGQVIEQSLEIMQWALPNAPEWQSTFALQLIEQNDTSFKAALDRYKYANRHPEFSAQVYRERGEVFLQQLDARLAQHQYLASDVVSVLDWAIFPFIRQFAGVDQAWFDTSRYLNLRTWLVGLCNTPYFAAVMQKNTVWVE